MYRGLHVPSEVEVQWSTSVGYWWRHGVDQATRTTTNAEVEEQAETWQPRRKDLVPRTQAR
jgi:hypothetical protein